MSEALIAKIHGALGGNGWAYTNYGGNELVDCRAELERVAALFDVKLLCVDACGTCARCKLTMDVAGELFEYGKQRRIGQEIGAVPIARKIIGMIEKFLTEDKP